MSLPPRAALVAMKAIWSYMDIRCFIPDAMLDEQSRSMGVLQISQTLEKNACSIAVSPDDHFFALKPPKQPHLFNPSSQSLCPTSTRTKK